MRFRPCIDIHNGKVRQIVGGTLKDEENAAVTNFSSQYEAKYYANIYKKDALKGGHIIMLNAGDSEYYRENLEQAKAALLEYPNGLQIGGGVNNENAEEFLSYGASHVIVTSYVFQNGTISWENIKKLKKAVGKEHIVLDLSCRKKEGKYYIVTDRWQTFTDVQLTQEVLNELAVYCDEFLVHGVDVEGKISGIEKELVSFLASWEKIPITYAGGIGSMEDLYEFAQITKKNLDFTIGSALNLFGGKMGYHEVIEFTKG